MNGQIQSPSGKKGPDIVWNPLRFAAEYEYDRGAYAVCILNQPVERKAHLLKLCDNGEDLSFGASFLCITLSLCLFSVFFLFTEE